MDLPSSNPPDSCRFCAEAVSGRILPEIEAWIEPDDSPLLTPPTGECLTLVYTRCHEPTFADLHQREAIQVVRLWREAYDRLATRFACVMTWETFGEALGQTERHPHGQACGIAFLPDIIAREQEAVTLAHERGLPCPFCLEQQVAGAGQRVVLESEQWLAFIPEYARYPYQTHLVTRRHHANLAELDESAATAELASSLLRILRAYNSVFQAPMPYMLVIHQLADPRFHLHIEILPVGRAPGKLKFAASGEMGFGLFVNDSNPAAIAAELRQVLAHQVDL